jgi:hypothetical protein
MDETTRRQLRVSDADRDAVVTELGEHFPAGRLEAAELDERTGRALQARVTRDLDDLMADLPRVPRPTSDLAPGPGRRRPPAAALLIPVLVAAALVTVTATSHGPWPHHAPWPLFWLIPLTAFRLLWLRHRPRAARSGR